MEEERVESSALRESGRPQSLDDPQLLPSMRKENVQISHVLTKSNGTAEPTSGPAETVSEQTPMFPPGCFSDGWKPPFSPDQQLSSPPSGPPAPSSPREILHNGETLVEELRPKGARQEEAVDGHWPSELRRQDTTQSGFAAQPSQEHPASPLGSHPGILKPSPPPAEPPEYRRRSEWGSKTCGSFCSGTSPAEDTFEDAHQHSRFVETLAVYLCGVKQRLCEAAVTEVDGVIRGVLADLHPPTSWDLNPPMSSVMYAPQGRCRSMSVMPNFGGGAGVLSFDTDIRYSRMKAKMSRESLMQCSKQALFTADREVMPLAPELIKSDAVASAEPSPGVRFSMDRGMETSLVMSGIPELSSQIRSQPALEHTGTSSKRLEPGLFEWRLLPYWVPDSSEDDATEAGSLATFEEVFDQKDMKELEWFRDQTKIQNAEDSDFAFIKGKSKISKLIISPFSTFRVTWDISGMFLISYDAISIPLLFFNLKEMWLTLSMKWFAMFFWLIDMVLNFFTGHCDPVSNRVEMRPYRIVRHYVLTWFIVDLLVVLPDWAIVVMEADSGGVARLGKVFRALRMLRALRLLRLAKFRKLVHVLENRLNNAYLLCYMELGKIMISIAVLIHILACCWFGMSSMNDDEVGWVKKFKYDEPDDKLFQYLTSLHWALSLFQGTMEVYPGTKEERAFAVVVQFLGLMVVSYFISSITHFMTEIRVIHNTVTQRRSALIRYLCDMNISPELSVCVKQFAEKVARTKMTTEEEIEILSVLPEEMRKDLDLEIKGPALAVHPLLNRIVWNDKLTARKLVDHMCQVSMHYSEILFKRGEESNQMYILMRGTMVYDKDPRRGTLSHVENSAVGFYHRPVQIGPNEWACEMGIWTMWQHRGMLTARAHCEVFGIVRERFAEIVTSLEPESARSVYAHASKFIVWINAQVAKFIDDLSHLPDKDKKRKANKMLNGASRSFAGDLSARSGFLGKIGRTRISLLR